MEEMITEVIEEKIVKGCFYDLKAWLLQNEYSLYSPSNLGGCVASDYILNTNEISIAGKVLINSENDVITKIERLRTEEAETAWKLTVYPNSVVERYDEEHDETVYSWK